jgi:hypothetical protein
MTDDRTSSKAQRTVIIVGVDGSEDGLRAARYLSHCPTICPETKGVRSGALFKSGSPPQFAGQFVVNVQSRYGRFALHQDRVFVTMSVMARPFVAAHLHQAVSISLSTSTARERPSTSWTRAAKSNNSEASGVVRTKTIMPVDKGHLDRLVADELSHMFGHPAIRDSEGDFEVIEYLNGTRTPLNVMDESSKKQQFRGIGGGTFSPFIKIECS